jgi:hypothetical protein
MTVSTTISSVMAVADTVDGRNIGAYVSLAVTMTAVHMTTVSMTTVLGLSLSLPFVDSMASMAVTVSGVSTAYNSKVVSTGSHHGGVSRGVTLPL